jgi:2-isopropylmalate synthase
MASVKLAIDDEEYVATETGVGPVDSAIKAIQKIVGKLVGVELKEYRLEAITGGSDALAEVIIKVEDDQGNIVSASSASEDIVKASVEAMVNGINKLLLKRQAIK